MDRPKLDDTQKNEQLNVRINGGLKKEVEDLFNALGLNHGTAITIYYLKILEHGGLPFNLKLEKEKTPDEVIAEIDALSKAKVKHLTESVRFCGDVERARGNIDEEMKFLFSRGCRVAYSGKGTYFGKKIRIYKCGVCNANHIFNLEENGVELG